MQTLYSHLYLKLLELVMEKAAAVEEEFEVVEIDAVAATGRW